MKYDYISDLKKHQKKYGSVYRLPDGRSIRLKDSQIKKYLLDNKLQLHQPSYQGDNVESEQVGIKHS